MEKRLQGASVTAVITDVTAAGTCVPAVRNRQMAVITCVTAAITCVTAAATHVTAVKNRQIAVSTDVPGIGTSVTAVVTCMSCGLFGMFAPGRDGFTAKRNMAWASCKETGRNRNATAPEPSVLRPHRYGAGKCLLYGDLPPPV